MLKSKGAIKLSSAFILFGLGVFASSADTILKCHVLERENEKN